MFSHYSKISDRIQYPTKTLVYSVIKSGVTLPSGGPPCCSVVSPPHTPTTSRCLKENYFQNVHWKLLRTIEQLISL